jgi:chemotaxis protein methyltransferase CheR
MSRHAPTAVGDGLEEVFPRIKDFLEEVSGIQLTERKVALVRARLTRRLRATGIARFEDYLAFVESAAGDEERVRMVDLLTTNKTSFFRESAHYDFLAESVLPTWERRPGRGPTVWSAGCSSGAEPYSLAMLLTARLGHAALKRARILATDLSTEMVARTRQARYGDDELGGVPEEYLRRWWHRDGPGHREAAPELRRLVRVAKLNLMGPWPMKGPFDLICCCNVMIYFDRATRERLVQRYRALLAPGAYLMVGHSESLNGMNRGLVYVKPAVYRREAE